MADIEVNPVKFTDTESIKLIRNTKGYNWEIKILGVNIDRLEELNEDMKKRFENIQNEDA